MVMFQSSLKPGVTATVSHTVRNDDLATVFGSGDVAVLATPRALAWCEQATVAAIAPYLQPGSTSVGLRVSLDHVAPSPIRTEVTAQATVEKIEGRRVTFGVQLTDMAGHVVATGRVVRVSVDLERFLARADDTGQVPAVRP